MNINTIAAEAGVSIATVSRVINTPSRVSDKNRAAVESVLRKYNYSPNSISNALSPNARKTIAIFSNNICHQHFASTAHYLDDTFLSLGYSALLCNTGNDLEKKKQHFRLLSEQHVNGVALVGSTFGCPEIEETITEYFPHLPVVISNGRLNLSNTYSVLIDHQFGIDAAMKHLLSRGHTSIGLVHSEVTFNAKRKIDAFMKFSMKNGLSVPESHVFTVPISVEGGVDAASQFIARRCDCTALIFMDDIVAVSAMNHFRRNGYSVPQDLAIIGYDNSDFSSCAYPALTTIDSKSQQLGIVMANTLHDLMNDRNVGNTIVIRPELVIRESS